MKNHWNQRQRNIDIKVWIQVIMTAHMFMNYIIYKHKHVFVFALTADSKVNKCISTNKSVVILNPVNRIKKENNKTI